MTIKQMKDLKAVNRAIDGVLAKISNENLHEILVNTCYQALIGSNWDPKRIMNIRESGLPKEFKGFIGKFMPVSFDKENGKYEFSHKKVPTILSKLGFTGDVSITFEEFANNFPLFYAKDESKKASDTIEKIQKAVGTRLGALNVERADDIASIVALLAKNPSILDQVSAFIANGE